MKFHRGELITVSSAVNWYLSADDPQFSPEHNRVLLKAGWTAVVRGTWISRQGTYYLLVPLDHPLSPPGFIFEAHCHLSPLTMAPEALHDDVQEG